LTLTFTFVVCPAIYTNRFRVVKMPVSTNLTKPAYSLEDAVRRAFVLEPHAEVILEHVGLWENIADKDSMMPHPFEPDKRVKVETSR
jgi:hypothetical protein